MKPRIFLLSVDCSVLATVADVVSKLGCEAFGTGSIGGAIAFLQDNLQAGDVAVVDVGREGNGFAMVNAMEDFREQLPWIAVTEPGAESFQALALINGAADVLAKPVNAGELSRAVTQICEHGFRR